jgi:hypothetical protein
METSRGRCLNVVSRAVAPADIQLWNAVSRSAWACGSLCLCPGIWSSSTGVSCKSTCPSLLMTVCSGVKASHAVVGGRYLQAQCRTVSRTVRLMTRFNCRNKVGFDVKGGHTVRCSHRLSHLNWVRPRAGADGGVEFTTDDKPMALYPAYHS